MIQNNESPTHVKTVLGLCFIAIIIMALLALGTSCKSKQSTVTDHSEIVDKEKNDSSHVETVNQAIKDEIAIPLPPVKTSKPDCDTICDQVLQDAMKRMQWDKQSGGNRYQMLWDEKQRLLRFIANMAETKNITTIVTKQRTIKKTITITKTITVSRVPGWVKYAVIWGVLCAIYFINKIRVWVLAKKRGL